MTDTAAYQSRVLDAAVVPVNVPAEHKPATTAVLRSIGGAAAALLLAIASLWRVAGQHRFEHLFHRAIQPLRVLHSGHVGDYVTFLTFGVAAYGAVLIMLMRVL